MLLDFDATVLAHGEWQKIPAVILDQSAFYPESGGQLGDHGTLGGHPVTDVQVDDLGVVLHILSNEARPPVGSVVHGTVDRPRRKYHMALHTGQHMLSRALLDEARAETVSSRLGSTVSTLDVDLAHIDEASIARAEALVNTVIDDDRPVRAWFPTEKELPGLPLRRPPKVTDNIRVVDINGWDYSPCGGTHCTRTSQVGVVTVTSVERYKGRMRVNFLSGRGALDELTARSRVLSDLARRFTCAPRDVPAGIERLRRDLGESQSALGASRDRYAASIAERLLADLAATGSDRAVLVLDGEPVDTLRGIATRVTARPNAAVFLASRAPEGLSVLVARGSTHGLDCGAWLKRLTALHGGRGGGRPDRAEGRLPPDAPWEDLARLP